MLESKSWIYGKLSNDSGILAVVPVENIVYMFPLDFKVLPVICYQELNQFPSQMDWFDDSIKAWDLTFQIDVWTENNKSTTAIAQAVNNVMTGLLFSPEYISDQPSLDDRTQHKVMRYSRKGVSIIDLI